MNPVSPRMVAWYRVAPLLLVIAGLAVWLTWASRAPTGVHEGTASILATDPLRRAAAAGDTDVPGLMVLACDADWRVRAAAFAALDRISPLETQPARDTPVAERERLLLDWLERYAAANPDLCDTFASAPHAQFGATLVERCLTCHAGPAAPERFAADRCLPCHATAHDQWRGSAHANSLTHLSLATVDPVTRVQGTFDFAGRRGLSCIACHEPVGADPRCVADFTTRSCIDCHADTAAQWERWRSTPQPRKATWPPGTIEFTSPDNPQGCTECHMTSGRHTWAARRDSALLAAGVAIKLARDDAGQATLTLTNLAGHTYPTGSTRRALEIRVRLDGGDEFLLATLAPPPATRDTAAPHPALDTGEERSVALPGNPDTATCRLIYVRDRFDPSSYRVEVSSLTGRFPPAPAGGQ